MRDPGSQGYVAQKQTNYASDCVAWVRTKLSSNFSKVTGAKNCAPSGPLCTAAALSVEPTKQTVPLQDFSRPLALHSLCITSQHGEEVLRGHILRGINQESKPEQLPLLSTVHTQSVSGPGHPAQQQTRLYQEG